MHFLEGGRHMNSSPLEITELLEKIVEFLPLVLPILLLQWSLMVYAIIKLLRSELPPKYMPKWAWILIILMINIIGPVLYLMIGRKEE